MKQIVISQKMSGTGTIHDLESEHYERVVRFRGYTRYAIVFAAYYNRKSITTSCPEKAAKLSAKYSDYSHAVIDSDGNEYTALYGRELTRN